ncbi:dispanin subfamily A member 2b-like [Cololabis saira]|uniref:dispanin subfamily A member 2b-like n=1 Tax=Cololabis saira TaxID=129043 RepID=UPI002AD432B6|nr:dispanin subfamily A member 2b-like [Cololabis saira]
MNPTQPAERYSSESLPMHGRMEMFSGDQDPLTSVQYTTINMVTEPPKDHIVWSLWCFFYGNPCCLGLAALIFSIKARDRKMVGDMPGARHYGSTACCLNTVATVLVSLSIIIAIITVSVILAQLSRL